MQFKKLLRKLLDEEWRLHTELFDTPRIGFILLAIGYALLNTISISAELLDLSIIALSFLIGLQTGTVGFITQEMLENMVGDFTSLIFTARMHPISERKTMIAFVIKDFIFYTFMLLLPLATAYTLGASGNFALAIFTTIAYYTLGAGITLNISTINTRSLSIAGLFLILVGYFASQNTTLLTQPLYALAVGTTLLFIAFYFFRTTPTNNNNTNTASRISQINPQKLPFSRTQNALVMKSIRDIQRSTGGLAKLPLMGGIIVGLLLAVAEFITRGTPFTLESVFLITTILATPTIVIYNWLFQDALEQYDTHPLEEIELYNSKKNAHYILLIPETILVLTIALYLAPTIPFALLSTLSFLALTLYIFGTLTYLTGFYPGSRLFDTKVYLQLTILTLVGIGPFTLLGFLFSVNPPTPTTYAITLTLSTIIGTLGLYTIETANYNTTNPTEN